MTGDVLRREADQHDRNAAIILSVRTPSFEDIQAAASEIEHAKDKRALAECLDLLPVWRFSYPVGDKMYEMKFTMTVLVSGYSKQFTTREAAERYAEMVMGLKRKSYKIEPIA
jgi:hypothetical protein